MFEFVLCVAVLVFIVGGFFAQRWEASQRVKQASSRVARVKAEFSAWLAQRQFSPQELFVSRTSCCGIAHDPSSQRIGFLTYENSEPRYSTAAYEDIVGSEVVIDGTVTSRVRTEDIVSRSFVGGLLGGEAGAIVGGATAARVTTETIRTIMLRVLVNDVAKPHRNVYFAFVRNGEVAASSAWAALSLEEYGDIDEWQSRLRVIMERARHERAS